jgi:hypothetical protein
MRTKHIALIASQAFDSFVSRHSLFFQGCPQQKLELQQRFLNNPLQSLHRKPPAFQTPHPQTVPLTHHSPNA